MLKIAKIIDKSITNFIRKFKVKLYGVNDTYAEQFHNGGDDYNPPINVKALSACIGNNPRDGVVFLYQDLTERKAELGEKRIYSTDVDGEKVTAEIHIKNNGDIVIFSSGNIITSGNMQHTGDLTVSGTVTGNIIIAKNGATSTYKNSVISENGIVTGGS